jgi:hypothetical protein
MNVILKIKTNRVDAATGIPLVRIVIERIAALLTEDARGVFGGHPMLVAVPGSGLTKPHTVWPSRRVCEELVGQGLGDGVLAIVRRTIAVAKSAGSVARPTLDQHVRSFTVQPGPCAAESTARGRRCRDVWDYDHGVRDQARAGVSEGPQAVLFDRVVASTDAGSIVIGAVVRSVCRQRERRRPWQTTGRKHWQWLPLGNAKRNVHGRVREIAQHQPSRGSVVLVHFEQHVLCVTFILKPLLEEQVRQRVHVRPEERIDDECLGRAPRTLDEGDEDRHSGVA